MKRYISKQKEHSNYQKGNSAHQVKYNTHILVMKKLY